VRNSLISAPWPWKNSSYNDLIPVSCSNATHAPRLPTEAIIWTCVRQAPVAGIPVWLIEDERTVPKRVQANDKRLA
jgi:hypothetical protein